MSLTASGYGRSGSPPGVSAAGSVTSEDVVSTGQQLDEDAVGDAELEEEEVVAIDVDPTFMRDAKWPGTIKIIVEATTFW